MCGAEDMVFSQRSSLQVGTDKLVDAVGVTAYPRETLRSTQAPQRPSRFSTVQTRAGRNKKWRTLDKGGRLEGNKRTRSTSNPFKPKPPPRPEGPYLNEDGTERPAKPPRVKPKKGPKPIERVSWAGQEMLLLADKSKLAKDIQPWASVRTERMPDDYYKYGPFGPHAWKGVTVGSPRKGTLCDKLVVSYSTVENEEEHELGDIQDAIVGYAQRLRRMDGDTVGIQFFFAFARQIVRVAGLTPWEDWTLVAQVAVESGDELDKLALGNQLDTRMWQSLTKCVAWYRPDLIYVKRPAFQVRFEPQKEFLEGWVKLLDPNNRSQDYYPRICELLGVEEDATVEKVTAVFQGLSEKRKMECVEHVLMSHPVCLLTPFNREAVKAEQQQRSNVDAVNEVESPEGVDDEEYSEDEDEDEDEDEAEPDDDFGTFSGEFGQDFDVDEEGDGNEWEREEAKALAAEEIQDSPDADERLDADVEMAFDDLSEIGEASTNGWSRVEETKTEEQERFLEAALRPFSYTNLIKEVFIIRKALVDMAELSRGM